MWCSVCYDLSVYTVIKAGIRICAKCVLRVRTRSSRVTRSVFATRSIAFKILSIPVTKSGVTAQGNVSTLYFLSIVVTPRRILTNTNEINLHSIFWTLLSPTAELLAHWQPRPVQLMFWELSFPDALFIQGSPNTQLLVWVFLSTATSLIHAEPSLQLLVWVLSLPMTLFKQKLLVQLLTWLLPVPLPNC